MTTFALRGNTEQQLHGSHSFVPVECRGTFFMQGPQPVSALPEWVVKAFNENPAIQQISISTLKNGVIYTRMEQSD